MHCLHIVGARPNFMKLAPLFHTLERHRAVRQTVVHTGQHYDVDMSDVFFQDLGLSAPDINLQVGSGSHATQTSQIMTRCESVLADRRPDVVIVYGDVNSTIAAALVCAKLRIRLAHVEAGLRSFDRSMPEEINRVLTDQIADLLFTPSADGNQNLEREGIPAERVFMVGNVMIDTLLQVLPQTKACTPDGIPARYALVTLHRPSNVDDHLWLERLLSTLDDISAELPIVFPVHPRTRQHLGDRYGGATGNRSTVLILPPLSYRSFLALERAATLVITDSGGIQEETTFLGIPCITVRENTERPVTISMGTNVLVGHDLDLLRGEVERVLSGQARQGTVPPLWDGRTSERIAEVLLSKLGPGARSGGDVADRTGGLAYSQTSRAPTTAR